MLSRANGVIWMDDEGDNQTNTNTNEQNHDINSISAFNSMQQLDEDNTTNWFLQSSSSPNSAFQNTDPNPVHFFLPPKPNFFNNSLNDTFDLGDVPGFYDFGSQPQIAGSNLAGNGLGSTGYPFSENGSTGNSLVLKPLDNFGSTGTPPTLFQKRVCLRRNVSDVSGGGGDGGGGGGEGDLSFDGSGLNYDSDEFNFEENGFKISGGDSSIANSGVTAGAGGGGSNDKGKKKGPPAKNLMAERRRRKKLNDRLYMLRSVVPKISKMDRASILGDAIEYLKELLQKINNLNHELEATPTSSNATTGSHPLTATPTSLPSRIKQELCPTAIPSPTGQPARVEVRQREGKAMNIHMFCSRRPGLLLSTIRALDDLGIDIQQAVISCFNGFALDVFRAEQCKEGQDVNPDAVRAVLLESAGCQGVA